MKIDGQSLSEAVSHTRARIDDLLDRFSSLRVLVVGDLMLDDYRAGDVERISPEAPVPIVRVREERIELGGAGNVARGVIALGARCQLVAAAGEDAAGEHVMELMRENGISGAGVVRTASRATPHKIRVIARGQQMLRIDREDDGLLAAEDLANIRDRIAERLAESDVVILQDYDKGLFGEGLAAWLIELARTFEIPVVADPKHDLRRFHGASLIKPNLEEARGFMPELPMQRNDGQRNDGQRNDGQRNDRSVSDSSGFEARCAMLEKIQHELGGAEIVVTRGAAGMTALDRSGQSTDVGTRPAEVFDVQGAGDTSIAALALCRAVGSELVDGCIVANAAATIAVGKMGTAAVGIEELRTQIPMAIEASGLFGDIATSDEAEAKSTGRRGTQALVSKTKEGAGS